MTKLLFIRYIFMYVLFAASMLLTGCQSKQKAERTANDVIQSYFDIDAYFEEQKSILKEKRGFEKTVEIDGKKEIERIDTLSLSHDLRPFLSSDINRASWTGKYVVDSIFNQDESLVRLSYSTNDPSLNIQKIDIEFEDREVTRIYIEKLRESFTVDSKQQLTYLPQKGYTIVNEQKTAVTEPFELVVEVRF